MGKAISSARSGGGTLALGLHGSLTVGKFGRSAEMLVLEDAECLAYSFGQKGLYGGLSFEFTGISVQRQRNQQEYASHFSQSSEITLEDFADLEWTERPEFATALLSALDDQACKHGSKSNEQQALVPGHQQVTVDFAAPAAAAALVPAEEPAAQQH